MTKHTFTFHHSEFGDDTESVWVAAWVDGKDGQGIGAYVNRNGEVILNDNIAWCVENDLEELGIHPESAESTVLLAEWTEAAREEGLRLFEEFDARPPVASCAEARDDYDVE